MGDHEPTRTTLSLHDAAQLMASGSLTAQAAERLLVRAIEHGELRASIKRWGTEQWSGDLLPGNVNPRDTWIERADLEAWQRSKATDR